MSKGRSKRRTTTKKLWTCPDCGRRFVHRRQLHSCGDYTVGLCLIGKSAHVISLYERFVALVRQCGPATVVPTKTQIGFQVRIVFANVTLRRRWLDVSLLLPRRLDHPRLTWIESFSLRSHAHSFRIHSLEELDDEVLGWLQEAYQVGEQKHLVK